MTPGPWTQHDEDWCPLEIWGNLDGPLQDGQIRGTQVCDVLTDETDAKLIAAAPELLAVCQQALRELTEKGVTTSSPWGFTLGLRLQRAIRKAGANA